MADLFEVKMKNVKDIVRFIYAGNSLFTIVSKKTNARFTYKIRGNKDKKNPMRFVRVLSGPDNENSYSYIGYMRTNNQGQIMAGNKGKADAPSFKALKWVIAKVCSGQLPENLEFYHSGSCGRCGRTLTVPESIRTGLGPVCAGRME